MAGCIVHMLMRYRLRMAVCAVQLVKLQPRVPATAAMLYGLGNMVTVTSEMSIVQASVAALAKHSIYSHSLALEESGRLFTTVLSNFEVCALSADNEMFAL